MAPRAAPSPDRRDEILDAATLVFARKGIGPTRMEDIAAETGLGKGTLYLSFPSKDALVLAVVERVFHGALAQPESRVAGHASATEAILRFTEAAIADYLAMIELMPVPYEFLALAFRSPEIQRSLQEYLQRYLAAITGLVRHGVDAGEFRQVDPHDVAVAAGAVYEGTVLIWVYDRTAVDIDHHLRSGIGMLLDGIRAVPTDEPGAQQ